MPYGEDRIDTGQEQETTDDSDDVPEFAAKAAANEEVKGIIEERLGDARPDSDLLGPHARFGEPKVGEIEERNQEVVTSKVVLPEGGVGLCTFVMPVPNPYPRLQAVYDYLDIDRGDGTEVNTAFDELLERNIPIRKVHIDQRTSGNHYVLDLPGRSKRLYHWRRLAQAKGLVTWKGEQHVGRRLFSRQRKWLYERFRDTSGFQAGRVTGRAGVPIKDRPKMYQVDAYKKFISSPNQWEDPVQIGEVIATTPRLSWLGRLIAYVPPLLAMVAAFAFTSSQILQALTTALFVLVWMAAFILTTFSTPRERWLLINDYHDDHDLGTQQQTSRSQLS
jgi:hypothetical protein